MLRAVLGCLSHQPQLAGRLLPRIEQQPLLLGVLLAANSHNSTRRNLSTLGGHQQQHTGSVRASIVQQHIRTADHSTDASAHSSKKRRIRQDVTLDIWQPYFHNDGVSKIPSRKPAIKRPARHQWRYCDVNYDPMEPRPKQFLPPYAPPRAHQKDYRAIYFAEKPLHNRKHYRRMWQKNEAIRELRWQQAWEARLAAQRKMDAKLKRMTDRIIRQRSWEAYKADPAAYVQYTATLEASKEKRRAKREQKRADQIASEASKEKLDEQ